MNKSKDFKVLLFGLNGTRWLANHLLHTVLEKNGFEVHSVFFREDYQSWTPIKDVEVKHVMEIVNELKPDLIGFSFTSFFVNEARELTRLIKKNHRAPIIWGGTHPSLDPEVCIKEADMVCIGEGEKPLVELAASIQNGEDRTDIQNIWFKKNGEILKNGTRGLIEDLDSIPFPDFSNRNKYFIVADVLYREDNPSPYNQYEYYILTGRGCPYMCTFCSNHKLSKLGHGKMLRKRSVENVIEELQQVIKKSPKLKMVLFYDDVFTYDRKWLRDFKNLYKREIGIPFFCYVHPNMIDEERIIILKEAGVVNVAMGFQHGSSRIRKGYFERNDSDESILKAAALFRKYRIPINLDTISTPFDTEEDNCKNIELLLKVPKPFSLAMHTLTFFPGYKITERALAEKVITQNQVVGSAYQKEIAVSRKEVIENPWLCYQSLMGKRYFPNCLIRFMIWLRFHENHLYVLRILADLSVRWERISGSFKRNLELLKNKEYRHFSLMFKYRKLFFK